MNNHLSAYFACNQCHQPYPEDKIPFRCPECGGVYTVQGALPYNPNHIDPALPGMWKYRHAFLLPPEAPVISLGEGGTPLIWLKKNDQHVGVKMESMNPTGSYKDRGTPVLLSQIIQRGASNCVEDSSGNAGASLSTYAAYAGFPAKIFIPATTSEVKLRQILIHGSEIIRVPGPRQNAADQVVQAANSGAVYASHAFLPFGLPGIATIAYECWESLGACPGTIIAPVGHGGLLAGIVLGFESLLHHKEIDRLPYFVGAQPAACAPLVKAAREGINSVNGFVGGQSLAEGTLINKPARINELLKLVDQNKGEFLAVPEDMVLPAYHELAKQGIWVEPTSTLTWCAYQMAANRLPEPVILVLSGAGYKYQPK